MDRDTRVKITNREASTIVYSVMDMGVRRVFQPRETKEVTFGELESLSYQSGGMAVLREFLIIRDEEAAKLLLGHVEPEYYYTTKDLVRLLKEGSQDEFLDCLDFAPLGVLEQVKDLAVDLPLNDVRKREAILKKLEFDVTKAIEIKETKYDGGAEAESTHTQKQRRVQNETSEGAAPARRAAAPPVYKIIEE